ncbi:peptidase C15, pyroglutamyl peptidase I-like protein [Rhodotorula sp. JG-1b]|nr:peptidase C15, pyroglutamyl peptidase I-like protein [Rhodotorula sp. JG-1b]
MAPIDSRDAQDRPFRVHLTGFGPFRDIKHNPSWLAVEPLNGEVLTGPPAPLSGHAASASRRRSPRRPILLSTSLLPVEYAAVEDLAPRLQRPDHDEETPPPDLVIHVGVSAGDSAIRLEQRARKFGYNSLDAAGRLAPSSRSGDAEGKGARRGFVAEEWEAAPEELRTVVDADKVIRWVKSQGVAFISPSDDAGLYLCEYSFFASMATAIRLNPANPTPVQFIHVPPVGQPYSGEELTRAIRLIVWAIVEEALPGRGEATE